jgi:threonine/homoserine/homoserine lactone efflux protein
VLIGPKNWLYLTAGPRPAQGFASEWEVRFGLKPSSMVNSFVPFLGVSLLIIVTPGQDTLLTVRNTVSGGRAAGFLTAVGVAAGQFTWTVAASLGLTAILLAYPAAFMALRVAGAAYLVYLGVQSLRLAFNVAMTSDVSPPGCAAAAPLTFLRQGLLSNLGNPKMLLFFTSLMPQFAAGSGGAPFVTLGVIFCLLTLGWLWCYVVVIGTVGHLLGRPGVRRTVDGVAGTALLVLGLTVAGESTR